MSLKPTPTSDMGADTPSAFDIITKAVEGAVKGGASAVQPKPKSASKMDTTTVLLIVGAIYLLSKGR